MTDTPLTAEVERAITDRLMAHIPTDPDDFPEFCQRVRAQFEGKDATIAALTTRAEQAEAEVTRLTTTGVRADERREMQKAVAEAQAAEERTKRAEARVAEVEELVTSLWMHKPGDCDACNKLIAGRASG